MPGVSGAVEQLSAAFKEGFKLAGQWLGGKEKRRMRAAIEAAENYIRADNDPSLSIKECIRRKRKYKEQFFKHNN
jgi:hypothetical protein